MTQVGAVAVDVANPEPGGSASNSLNAEVIGTITIPAGPAARFAEQTTFGPTPAVINQIQIQGLQNFLNAQYTAPITPYADPAAGETSLGPLQQRYWIINLTAQERDYLSALQADFFRVHDGIDVITAGNAYRCIFVLNQGLAIRYKVLHDGRRQILSLVLPGDFIGFPGCLFDNSLYSVASLGESTACSIASSGGASDARTRPRTW